MENRAALLALDLLPQPLAAQGMTAQGMTANGLMQRAMSSGCMLLLVAALGAGIAPEARAQPAAGTASAGTEALADLSKQARAGDAGAMARYGRALALGEGITKNSEQALDWLRRAAERGSVQGMYWYATMLHGGEGGPANQTLAVSWMKRASENGHLSSMFALAQAYASGQGTEQNLPLAYAWATIVANAEPLKAPTNPALQEFKQRAQGLQQNLAKAISPEIKASADQSAANWVIGTQPQVRTGSGTGAASSGLPGTPSGTGLPPAPRPVPGADNPLNQRPTPIDPMRPRSDFPGAAGPGMAAASPQQASPSAGNPQSGSQAQSGSGLRRVSSGTAFFVTIQGALVTNHHVIKDCKQVRIIDGADVRVMAIDPREDLAILIGPPLGRAVTFRATDRVNQGEDVLAYGFPLQSVLATSGQIGAGLVSATSGLRNNPSQLQIDVPLQVGNSGGPLLDRQGQLVGMTVSKLNAMQMARATGDIPQNVNFAIKHSVIKRFLEAQKLQYLQGNKTTRLDTSAIAEEARTYTVALECLA